MATIIEHRDSSNPAGALLIFILFALLLVGGIWFAYTNGILGKPSVIENNKTVIVPTPSAPSAPTPVSNPQAK